MINLRRITNLKKIALITLMLLMIPNICFAEDKKEDEVKFSNCVDSTSARFILGVEEVKVKFIGIETGEFIVSDDLDETNGKTVAEYVCSLLKEAKKIKLEYEPKIKEKDKFGRINAWVFVDDVLLEENLVSIGAAKVAYLYDDYKYNDVLITKEKEAKDKGIGIWKEKVTKTIPDEEEVIDDNPKEEGLLNSIGNFFKDVFDGIIGFFNGIVEDILE
jgi:micrococcal nuclease